MAARVPLDEKDRYIQYRNMGAGIVEAAARVGRSRSWAHRFEVGLPPEMKTGFPGKVAAHRKAALVQRPVPVADLGEEAVRALGDFEFFRRRYFGRVSTPWQVEAGETLTELLASPDDEFVVLNCPPGSGKTTLFTCDIPAWQIVRNRAVRVLLGHRVQARANEYSGRLRQMLVRRVPLRADPRMVALGLAVDASSTLVADFGPFKPSTSDELWRREQFTVIQDAEVRADEKESTVAAFGSDSGQLGYRADMVVWDDLSSTRVRTPEAVGLRDGWFDDEAVTRLEPGGVFAVVEQRLGPNDVSSHCLAKTQPVDDPDDEDDDGGDAAVFRHLVYPAHVESACRGLHAREDPPYPGHGAPPDGGCLLDPRRLSWKKLAKVRQDGRRFRVVYQQEEVDPGSVLVPKQWVDGGVDPESGEEFIGCWDNDRRVGELPRGLARPLLSVATADPSPTKFWSIQWWVVQPETGLRFLMAQERKRMAASELLDWNAQDREFTGIMEEWFWWSAEKGVPIQTWVVEANAAQTFMFQYDHFRRWMQARGVRVVRHTTASNKADPQWGVEATLPPIWRRGQVRLPGHQDTVTRTSSMKLVDEVTKYPTDGVLKPSTDDCVMGQWFLEFQLPKLTVPERDSEPEPRRPSFLQRHGLAARTAA